MYWGTEVLGLERSIECLQESLTKGFSQIGWYETRVVIPPKVMDESLDEEDNTTQEDNNMDEGRPEGGLEDNPDDFNSDHFVSVLPISLGPHMEDVSCGKFLILSIMDW